MKHLLRIVTVCLPSLGWAGELPRPDAVFAPVDQEEAALGQMLFYDPILSGSKTVSCATCHHPRFATSDGLSLGIGDGGAGLGPERVIVAQNLPEERIPRNSPALFNLGAAAFSTMFHDGRLQADASRPSGIRTPLGQDMVGGFASVLSTQAMFPVLSGDEMAGHYSESDVSQATRQGFITGPEGVWSILSRRIEEIPAYRAAFDNVIGDRPIEFTDIANVIAAFVAAEWRADDSLFDAYLKGQAELPGQALLGLRLFYGKAGCAECHTGQFQTDHAFHAIAMPQIGPGKAARFERHHRDIGRMRVTGDPADAYKFRTPSLRNVTQTAPYGHSGAYATLEGVVRHHLDPVAALHSYDTDQAVLPDLPGAKDFVVLANDTEVAAIAAANSLQPIKLTDAEVSQILAFLATLDDQTSLSGRMGIPASVHSGLIIDR